MGRETQEGRAFSAKFEGIILVILLAGLVLGLRSLPFREALDQATIWIESLGWWAPAAFLALYVASTMLLIPRSVLTLASGLIFGLFWGGLWALLAINLGANLAFLTGRHFVRAAVSRRTRDHGRLDALDRAVARDGWKIVALTRLSPVFPYSFLNYAFGLTRVTWRQYALGSSLGLLPGTLLLVALGTLTDLAAEKGGSGAGGTSNLVVIASIVVALVATFVVTRFAKRAFERSARSDQD